MVRLTDRLDVTIIVDWDVKPLIKQTKQNIKHHLSFLSILSFLSLHHILQDGRYHKTPKFSDTQEIAVIILKFE